MMNDKLDGVYCGDSAVLLRGLQDVCIDLTVTSPPYDDLRTYDGFTFDFETIARELFRVTKPGGVVVWVVGDGTVNGSESGESFRQALFFKEVGFKLHDTMIYEKSGFAFPESNRYYQVFEFMFVFAKEGKMTTNLLVDRENRFKERWGRWTQRGRDGSLKDVDKTYKGKSHGVRFNVWRYVQGYGYGTADGFAYEHPAMFPEELARDHILSWSNVGDVVLDPFAGAGTTLKMAKSLGRHYIGFEISERFCKLARRRVDGAPVPLLDVK